MEKGIINMVRVDKKWNQEKCSVIGRERKRNVEDKRETENKATNRKQ